MNPTNPTNRKTPFPVECIGVIGLGYVGLSLATAFGRVLPTIGFDIDHSRIRELEAGCDRTGEIALGALKVPQLTLANDPALAKSAKHLNPGGFVYVEVPDGEAAVHEGPGREEFFIEHHHVFSAASLALLATRAGFNVQVIERLHEPSTKYTLRGFLIP